MKSLPSSNGPFLRYPGRWSLRFWRGALADIPRIFDGARLEPFVRFDFRFDLADNGNLALPWARGEAAPDSLRLWKFVVLRPT